MNRITSTITWGYEPSPLRGLHVEQDWHRDMNSWTVQMRYQGRRFTFPFYTGLALGEPNTFDAAYCIIMDARLADQEFEDWCWELGYDSDSRRAEQIYRECVNTWHKLQRLFKRDFDEILSLSEDQLREKCR